MTPQRRGQRQVASRRQCLLAGALTVSSACASSARTGPQSATAQVASTAPSASSSPTPAIPLESVYRSALRECLAGTYQACLELDASCAQSASKLCPANIEDPRDETSFRMGVIKGLSKTSQFCNMYGDGGTTAALVCTAGDRGTIVRVAQGFCKLVRTPPFAVLHFVSPVDQATADIDPASCWVRFRL